MRGSARDNRALVLFGPPCVIRPRPTSGAVLVVALTASRATAARRCAQTQTAPPSPDSQRRNSSLCGRIWRPSIDPDGQGRVTGSICGRLALIIRPQESKFVG